MNIGIYESEHFETLYPVLRLLDNGQHTITVYTTLSVARQLYGPLGEDRHKFTWVLKEDTQSHRSFILSMSKHAQQKSYGFFLLNTVSSNHLLFARMISQMPATSFYWVIHDVNNIFRSRLSLGLRKIIRHIGKVQLQKKVTGFFSISSRTTEYLAGIIQDGRKVKWLPGAVFEEAHFRPVKLESQEPIRMVVPGSLDSSRRNYQEVFELAEWVAEKKLPVEITLLGGAVGKEAAIILERCRETAKTTKGFSFYEIPEVPYEEFDTIMRKAHVIWVPSRIKTIMADDIEETYGESKSSGTLFDAIRYAKPLLVPKGLAVDKEQQESAFVYASREALLQLITEWSAQPAIYNSWADRALEVSRKYIVTRWQPLILNYFIK